MITEGSKPYLQTALKQEKDQLSQVLLVVFQIYFALLDLSQKAISGDFYSKGGNID